MQKKTTKFRRSRRRAPHRFQYGPWHHSIMRPAAGGIRFDFLLIWSSLGDGDGLWQGDPCLWLCALFGGGCCEIAFTSAASLSIHSTLSVISCALGIEHYVLMDRLPGSILTFINLVPSKCALYSGSIVLLSPDYGNLIYMTFYCTGLYFSSHRSRGEAGAAPGAESRTGGWAGGLAVARGSGPWTSGDPGCLWCLPGGDPGWGSDLAAALRTGRARLSHRPVISFLFLYWLAQSCCFVIRISIGLGWSKRPIFHDFPFVKVHWFSQDAAGNSSSSSLLRLGPHPGPGWSPVWSWRGPDSRGSSGWPSSQRPAGSRRLGRWCAPGSSGDQALRSASELAAGAGLRGEPWQAEH